MMQVVIALGLLVLTGAVVLLFAMMGELASRVPPPEGDRPDQRVIPLNEALVGNAPDAWPSSLAHLSSASDGLLIVLSTVCNSCRRVAGQLSPELGADGARPFAVLISCPGRDRGEDFAQRHALGRFPYFVDEHGDWVTRAFGVLSSPSALFLREGRLESALQFQDLTALQAVSNGQVTRRS
ncbi:MAG TPA: hypothetical protein VIC57_11880 [Candidatus Dormibacteraeota bacterium]|jgi:hypothetical protein